MLNTKTKSTLRDARARAKSIVSGYHEGITPEQKLTRKQVTIHMLICMITSDWWSAIAPDHRTDIIHHMVEVDDTMDALDVMYS